VVKSNDENRAWVKAVRHVSTKLDYADKALVD
jgi:hypothetical protein